MSSINRKTFPFSSQNPALLFLHTNTSVQESNLCNEMCPALYTPVCGSDGNAIKQRLQRIPFMNESGRKMFIYDSFCRDPVDWGVIKKHKRSHWMGAKVEMKLTQAGIEEGDTLAVLKDMYQTFRTERADHLSEDVVVVLGARCERGQSCQ